MDENPPDGELVTVVVGEERVAAAVSVAEPQEWVVDDLCAAAVDLARSALLQEADAALIGDPVGVTADGPLVVTHYFEGHVPGYTGWRWAVTLTRAPDAEQVTVDETALLPDETALLAPAWVPWKQRIESGDLGAGDVMVTDPDDGRLIAGMTENDLPETAVEQLRPEAWELGLGRVRLLSPEGRREAAHRWYREVGPRSPIARGVDLHCGTCGFLLLIGGPLGQAFGVCANGYSPVDGRVVAMNFGCGAHSEIQEAPNVAVAEIVIDEIAFDDLGPVPVEPDEPAVEPQPADAQPTEAGDDPVQSPDAQDDHATMQGTQTEEDS